MMNIGTNPTVNNTRDQSIEVHFFDFNESLYDKKLQIDILSRIRDEQKFDSIKQLQEQLIRDKKIAESFIKSYEY